MFGLTKLKKIVNKSLKKASDRLKWYGKRAMQRTKLKRAIARNEIKVAQVEMVTRRKKVPGTRTGFVNGQYIPNGVVRLHSYGKPNSLGFRFK